MNKVLVTGLGVAKEFDICESCNLDFSWLVTNPSTLLWSDEICIPQKAYEIEIQMDDDKTSKVIKMFLDMASNKKLINKIDISSMYQKEVRNNIHETMLSDTKKLMETFPQIIQKGEEGVPHEIRIEEFSYCGAAISSIYAGIKVAQDMEAHCLFSDREHTYLKYLYGVDYENIDKSIKGKIYNEVFSMYLPESIGIHNYAFVKEEICCKCNNYSKCKDTYLNNTEKALKKIFEWRDYDELQQAKEQVNKIIKTKNQIISSSDINDIAKEFNERQISINKNINKRFPQIERWTKLIAVIATPLTIASAATGNNPLTVASAAATGLAGATESAIEYYKNKNNWVGFVNSLKNN